MNDCIKFIDGVSFSLLLNCANALPEILVLYIHNLSHLAQHSVALIKTDFFVFILIKSFKHFLHLSRRNLIVKLIYHSCKLFHSQPILLLSVIGLVKIEKVYILLFNSLSQEFNGLLDPLDIFIFCSFLLFDKF